ncbi:MAG: hypothetical protein LBD37_02665 [Treponema sp.]|nr:hypothetical protein [Treponema sp.]
MAKNLFQPVLAKAALYPFKAIVLLAGILLVYSCDFPGNLPDRADGPSPQALGSGEGNLTVNFSGGGNTRSGGRAVLSDSFTSSLEYKVKGRGPGGAVIEQTATGGSIVLTLNAGDWDIEVNTYGPPGAISGDPLVGTGKADAVTVAPGQNQGVTIEMSVDPAYEATLTQIYIHNEAELRRVGVDFAIDNTMRFYLERDIVLTQPWTPIGDSTTPFEAEFDGQGYRITMSGGFDSAALENDDLGLIGYADGADIKELTIELAMGSAVSPVLLPPLPGGPVATQNIGGLAGTLANNSTAIDVTVKGSFCVKRTGTNGFLVLGGIAGLVTGGSTIESCTVSDMVLSGDSDGPATTTGGVAGATNYAGSILSSYAGSILKSSFSGTVNSGGLAGGIVGLNFDGLIGESHAMGTIKGGLQAGGIAGGMQTSGGGTSSIAESSFTGTVSAENPGGAAYAGGVLGQSYAGSIERSYAAANVKAQGPDAYAGGIAGYCNAQVSDCYAYANVLSNGSGGSGAESFAGGIGGHTPKLEQCYAAGTVKAQGSGGTAVYAGGISGQVENMGGLKNCMVLLDALDGGSSADVHTLFGDASLGYTSNSGNKVWDAIAITRGGTTYNSGGYPTTPDYDIASFDLAASFNIQGTYAAANWDFAPGTGDWKFITGAGYDFPVLDWQTAPPDLNLVLPH